MSEKVSVSVEQLNELLRDPQLQSADWRAHCGCQHFHDGRMVKCSGHAAGQLVVEAERQ